MEITVAPYMALHVKAVTERLEAGVSPGNLGRASHASLFETGGPGHV